MTARISMVACAGLALACLQIHAGCASEEARGGAAQGGVPETAKAARAVDAMRSFRPVAAAFPPGVEAAPAAPVLAEAETTGFVIERDRIRPVFGGTRLRSSEVTL